MNLILEVVIEPILALVGIIWFSKSVINALYYYYYDNTRKEKNMSSGAYTINLIIGLIIGKKLIAIVGTGLPLMVVFYIAIWIFSR